MGSKSSVKRSTTKTSAKLRTKKKAEAPTKLKTKTSESGKTGKPVKTHKTPKRCWWCGDDRDYVSYHDDEWGVPLRDSQAMFALLQLEGMQAGLAWITVLRKRDHMHKRFFKFQPRALVKKGPAEMPSWLEDAGLIRNRAKLSALIGNAQAYIDYERDNGKGSFVDFLWGFVDGKVVQNRWRGKSDVPATTPQSEAMSKALKKLGFRFVGPTICYAFMQSAGLVNDHARDCFRHSECAKLAP